MENKKFKYEIDKEKRENIRERREKVKEFVRLGISPNEIADKVGVSRKIINKDLFKIRKANPNRKHKRKVSPKNEIIQNMVKEQALRVKNINNIIHGKNSTPQAKLEGIKLLQEEIRVFDIIMEQAGIFDKSRKESFKKLWGQK